MNPSRAFLVAAAAILVSLPLAGCKGSSGGSNPVSPTPAPGRASALFASAAANPGLVVSLPPTASGSVSPLSRFGSTQTPDFGPNELLAFDPAGRLWVTSCSGAAGADGPVTAFNPSSNSLTARPLLTIGGPATGLSGCQLGLTVDGAGNVFVADPGVTGAYPGGQIAVFGSGQQGNVAPVRRIAGSLTTLQFPAGIALNNSGNVAVANTGSNTIPPQAGAGSVTVFAGGASGNVAPLYTLGGSSTALSGPFGVTFDRYGYLYVTNPPANSITVYAPGASGNAAPVATIAGSDTRLSQPSGIAVDNAGFIYVGTLNQSAGAPVFVFAPGSNGNVAPVQALTVTAPRFAAPSGIAVQ
jgi:hypothetical protein